MIRVENRTIKTSSQVGSVFEGGPDPRKVDTVG